MPDTFVLQTRDGLELKGYRWEPEAGSPPRAILLLVHGIGEHARRYGELADFFTKDAGMAFWGLDLRGHGESSGKRGHAAPREAILADLDAYVALARKTWPGVKCFLYGHSMGGNFSLSHRLYGKVKPTGYVITSPWILLYREPPRIQTMVMRLISTCAPAMTIKNGIDSSQISSDQSEGGAYAADPYMHNYISAGTAYDCWRLGHEILNRAGEPHEPFILLQGEADTIVSPDASSKFAKQSGHQAVYVSYPEMRHELHHEKVRKEARETISTWILSQM